MVFRWCVFVAVALAYDFAPGQSNALNGLYTGLGCPSALCPFPQSFETTCGPAERIRCVEGSVVYLDFHGLGLIGTISERISGLIDLEELYLHENSLHGTLPTGLAALTNLNKLRLYHNNLTGTPRLANGAVVCDLVGETDENNCFECPGDVPLHSTCQCNAEWVGCPDRPPAPPLQITGTRPTLSSTAAASDKTTTTRSPLNTTLATTTPESTAAVSAGSDPTGPIIGIAVGVLLVLLVIGLVTWLLVRRKQRAKKPSVLVDDTASPPADDRTHKKLFSTSGPLNDNYDIVPPAATDIPDVATEPLDQYAKAPAPPLLQYDAVPPLSTMSTLSS